MSYLAIALIVFAAVGAASLAAHGRHRGTARSLDAGAVSQEWLAENRRQEEA